MADDKKQPPHNLFIIEGDGKTSKFHNIGVAWPTKSGDGFTIDLPPGLMVSGRLAILPRKEKAE